MGWQNGVYIFEFTIGQGQLLVQLSSVENILVSGEVVMFEDHLGTHSVAAMVPAQSHKIFKQDLETQLWGYRC